MKPPKRRDVRADRAAPRARQRRRGPARYQPAKRLTRNQPAVAKRLVARRIDLVAISGWGFVARLLTFLDFVGYRGLLDLEGTGFRRVMIPIARLLLTYHLKVLLGVGSINLLPARLFRAAALLHLIGYTTTQVASGFCQRGQLTIGPMHPSTLADAVERLTAAELEAVLNGTVGCLVARGLLTAETSRGHFALDATDLPTTRRCRGAGRKAVTERKVTRARQVVEVQRTVHGFKLLIVYEVRPRLVVAAKVVPINEHESRHTRALVHQAVANLGAGVPRVLLIDRGCLDGADPWWLKHDQGIDFVIPSKDDMRVTADARGLCRRPDPAVGIVQQERAGRRQVRRQDGKAVWAGQVTAVAVPELRSYDQYGTPEHAARANRSDFAGNLLDAVVVTSWQGQAYPPGQEKVFLTSRPVDRPLAVLDLYDLRSLIENTAFRELKQGWHLEQFPKKTAAAVRSHVILTLLTFTLANAFQAKLGRALAGHGIRRQRAEQQVGKVIVFAGGYYAIFDIEELLILLGIVPKHCLRADPARARHRYGLRPVA